MGLRKWFRLPDGLLAVVLLSISVAVAVVLSPLIILTRVRWLVRARRRAASKPRSLLILSYTTYDQAVAKGIMADPNLWYNCGGKFERVQVYVALAAEAADRRLTSCICYTQDGRILPDWEPAIGWTLLLVRYLRGWWRACRFALNSDVMLVNGPNRAAQIGIVTKLVTSIPTLVFIEAFWEEILAYQDYFGRWQQLWLPYWYRVVYRAFDAYTGTPSFAVAMYGRWGVRPERIFAYVHNVDVVSLASCAAKAAIPAALKDRPRPWIATIGRLHPEKKSDCAVRLQSCLSKSGIEATGILVGGGESRAELEQLSRDLGVHDRVVFAGQLPQSEGLAIAAASDFYFAPMQGNALVEAMAAACCIVAFDNHSHRIFVEDGHTALLVPEGDVDRAARSIIELKSDPSRAERLRAAARAEAMRRYTPQNIAHAWFAPFAAIYDRALQ